VSGARGASVFPPPPGRADAWRGALRTWIKTLFLGPKFVLALAGIRRLVVRIEAIKNDDLLPGGSPGGAWRGARRTCRPESSS